MNIKRAAVTVAAITTLAGAPALAFAQTNATSDPIILSNVQVYLPETVGNGSTYKPGTIYLDFRNTAKVAATEVLFDVRGNGMDLDYLRDPGTFSPGVLIRHTFPTQSYATDRTVTVARVKFADGSVWDRNVGYVPAGPLIVRPQRHL